MEELDKKIKGALNHIIQKQNYIDKYELKDARYVQFFIDTSGIEGCSSNRDLNYIIPQVIHLLELQGYECMLAACGNGFYDHDMVEDDIYNIRETLESYGAGKVSKIACPTPETAAKMANEAEFSIIMADFDGLTSICKMAELCQKDKAPYFLCLEDRYSWEAPTYHDWVDPDESYYYDPERVYDVSLRGMPSLEEFYKMEEENELCEGLVDEEYEINEEYQYDQTYENDNIRYDYRED